MIDNSLLIQCNSYRMTDEYKQKKKLEEEAAAAASAAATPVKPT